MKEYIVASLIERSGNSVERHIDESGNSQGRLLRVPDAATFVGLSISMLNKMRVAGTGPRFVKLAAKAIGYWEADLVDWLNARACYSTTEGANLS